MVHGDPMISMPCTFDVDLGTVDLGTVSQHAVANSVFTFHVGWAEKACAGPGWLHFGKMLIVGVKFKLAFSLSVRPPQL